MMVVRIVLSCEGVMKRSCDQTCASAYGTRCLVWGALQLSVHARLRNAAPTERVQDVAALEPPHLIVVCELFKAYITFREITVADDRWRS
eukprot:7781597-Pyramimonas_sp.AAC.1